MYEVVEFVEVRGHAAPTETVVGVFSEERLAVNRAREARSGFLASGRDDYAWWIVRTVGKRVAAFIADSKSDKEFVLDLTSNELVEIA
ncbi:MAG: hypothetical protein KY394_05015 [Actinobacteria bacterium]|nr:hypothetical protein [Actinomycetota bacterium]